MINLKKINSIDWTKQNISILGAGISGLGATKLASYLKANVLLSESKNMEINIPETDNFKYECDGHSDQVLKSDLIIKSPGIPNKTDIIIRSKKENIPIVSEIEFASWFSNSDIIAVTGSNGKTTTVNLIFEIFKKTDIDVLVGGNIGVSYSENVLCELRNKKNFVHILEISSYQAEHLYNFTPKISCILNISEDHMDRYESMNDYINAKLNIFKNLSKKTKVIYNGDDEILSEKISSASNIIPFSIKQDSIIKLNHFKSGCLEYDGKKYVLKNAFIGIHNFYNLLAVELITREYGIHPEEILRGIENFNPLPHRIEDLGSFRDIRFINDSKSTTLESTLAAIECFENIILIIGGDTKGKINLEDLSKCINHANIKNTIIYGDVGKKLNIRFEHSLKTLMLDLEVPNSKQIYMSYKFYDAVYKSIELSSDGNVIVLSPGFASFDQFKNYKERGNVFKKYIKKIMDEKNDE